MTRELVIELLKQHAISITNARVYILMLVMNSRKLISQYEIVKQCAIHCNRITVYRTLHFFCEIGILYKVLDQGSKPHYSLNVAEPTRGTGKKSHLNKHFHFKCTSCGKITCLPASFDVSMLPEGFTITKANLLLIGQCVSCTSVTKE